MLKIYGRSVEYLIRNDYIDENDTEFIEELKKKHKNKNYNY